MNPAFKSKYDQMRESKPTDPDAGSAASSSSDEKKYSQAGNIRNLCFVWLDGKRIFLNYSYLVSGELSPDQSLITLEFTTHNVHLKGFYLQNIYEDIMQQLIVQVVCEDPRYASLKNSSQSFISAIQIEKSST